MVKESIYSTTVPSTLDDLRTAIETIIKKINRHNVPVTLKRDEIYLVLDEAITNAMEHGNKWDPEKTVSISVTNGGSRLCVCIEDEGDGFDTAGTECNSSRNCLAPRGRGIKIIKRFCKTRWNEKGNRIELFIEYEN